MTESSVIDRNPTETPSSPVFRRGHNIVAVASGKGGVGKTWF